MSWTQCKAVQLVLPPCSGRRLDLSSQYGAGLRGKIASFYPLPPNLQLFSVENNDLSGAFLCWGGLAGQAGSCPRGRWARCRLSLKGPAGTGWHRSSQHVWHAIDACCSYSGARVAEVFKPPPTDRRTAGDIPFIGTGKSLPAKIQTFDASNNRLKLSQPEGWAMPNELVTLDLGHNPLNISCERGGQGAGGVGRGRAGQGGSAGPLRPTATLAQLAPQQPLAARPRASLWPAQPPLSLDLLAPLPPAVPVFASYAPTLKWMMFSSAGLTGSIPEELGAKLTQSFAGM